MYQNSNNHPQLNCVTVNNIKITFSHLCSKKKTFFSHRMSEATSSTTQNRQPTETEIINVTIPYTTIPSPPDTTDLQTDNTQEESYIDDRSETTSEATSEIIVNTSERKNSWVWPFYRQVQTLDGDVFTICEVEIDVGVKCNKRYKTKGSTGNLINHLLKHGITKDNPQPSKVYKLLLLIIFNS